VTRSVDSCGVSDADAAGVGNDPDRVVGIDREIPRARTSDRCRHERLSTPTPGR
jgi:hypothetical protein